MVPYKLKLNLKCLSSVSHLFCDSFTLLGNTEKLEKGTKNCNNNVNFFFQILYKICTYGLLPVSFQGLPLKLEGEKKDNLPFIITLNSTRGHLTLHCTGNFDMAYCF